LVANVKAEYGILNEDTYNFDETGFQIGVGVATAAGIRHNPIGRQSGDREWITLITAVNAADWLVPPFFIFEGKNHNQSWYHNNLKEWGIAIHDNGWTINKIGVAWLQHFYAVHAQMQCSETLIQLTAASAVVLHLDVI
jgi:hypothetical protein